MYDQNVLEMYELGIDAQSVIIAALALVKIMA